MTTERRTSTRGLVLVVFSEDQVLYDGKKYIVWNPLTKVYGELAKELQVIVSGPTRCTEGTSSEGYSDHNIVYSSRPYYGGSVRGFFKSLPRIIVPTLQDICANVDKADLVMVRLPSPIGFLVWRTARRRGKPCFLYLAGDIRKVAVRGEKYSGPLTWACVVIAAHVFHWLTKRMAKGTLVFTTGSELYNEFKDLADRCVNIVPSVVSEADIFYREDVCKREPFKLLYVGRLVPVKGLRYLLQAVKLLSDKGIDVELEVMGDGYHRAALEVATKELGLEERVHFLGRIAFGSKLFEVYRRADIFVLPSLSEGIPKTLLEAMASGLPIVATRVGGVPDVIKDGETGLLVEPRSPEQIAKAVQRLIEDPPLRRSIIRNGYAFAKDHTVEKQAELMWREIRSFFNLESK